MLPQWNWTWDLSHLDLMLSSLTYWGMCYLEDLRSLCGHSLLVITKWSMKWCRNKRQFKDIPSSTCLDSSERKTLDLDGWGPRFNAHSGNILLLDFLTLHGKVSDANIAIIANFACSWKTRVFTMSWIAIVRTIWFLAQRSIPWSTDNKTTHCHHLNFLKHGDLFTLPETEIIEKWVFGFLFWCKVVANLIVDNFW